MGLPICRARRDPPAAEARAPLAHPEGRPSWKRRDLSGRRFRDAGPADQPRAAARPPRAAASRKCPGSCRKCCVALGTLRAARPRPARSPTPRLATHLRSPRRPLRLGGPGPGRTRGCQGPAPAPRRPDPDSGGPGGGARGRSAGAAASSRWDCTPARARVGFTQKK